MDTFQSETLKVFKDTQMYLVLNNICQLLNLNYPLNNFKLSSPFWQSNEASYNCYLQVLEDEYYTILKKNLPEVKEVKVIILKRYLKLSKK